MIVNAETQLNILFWKASTGSVSGFRRSFDSGSGFFFTSSFSLFLPASLFFSSIQTP